LQSPDSQPNRPALSKGNLLANAAEVEKPPCAIGPTATVGISTVLDAFHGSDDRISTISFDSR
jgi:hypothetical protein